MCELLPEGVPRGWATVAAAPSRGLSVSTMRAITVRRDFPGWAQMLRLLGEGPPGGGWGKHGEVGFHVDAAAAEFVGNLTVGASSVTADDAAGGAAVIARVTAELRRARFLPVELAAFVQCCEVGGGGCDGECSEAASFTRHTAAVKTAIAGTKLYSAFLATLPAGGALITIFHSLGLETFKTIMIGLLLATRYWYPYQVPSKYLYLYLYL